jgi:glycerophosphoryl diester phosphodiesterase
MRRSIAVLLALVLPHPVSSQSVRSHPDASVKVTALEAIHLAEIHTGAAVSSVEPLVEGSVPTYQVEVSDGGVRQRVRIHGGHGRLLSVARLDSNGGWQTVYRWPGVRVVAHRGGALLGPPENTLPAIRKAIEIGADLIEIDIRETADGQLVLMHDATVDRTTTGRGRVRDLTLEEIRRLEIRTSAGSATRVPTLREALDAMRGNIDCDLDFKEGDLNALVAEVRAAGMVDAATFCSPVQRCQALARLEPRIRLRPTAEYPQQIPTLIRDLRPALVNLDWHAVTEEAVRTTHLGGCHAFVNCLATADTTFYIRWAAEIGADYIQSDRPDVVINILKEMGLRKARPALGDPLGTPLRAEKLKYPLK